MKIFYLTSSCLLVFLGCMIPGRSKDEIAVFHPTGMVLIPSAGKSFQMGSLTGDTNEVPVHTVTLTHDFWMDTTEVTQADYKSLMGSDMPMFKGDLNPEDMISFKQAITYCNARSLRDSLEEVYDTSTQKIDYSKNGYRLPTEAEWEFACRAKTTTDTYWGDDDPNKYGWSRSNRDSIVMYPVAQLLPNAFGLYDMNGNAWEYCNDWYGLYKDTSQTDPTGPDSGTHHVMRGGCTDSNLEILTSTVRVNPYVPDKEYGRYGWGFRVVLPVK